MTHRHAPGDKPNLGREEAHVQNAYLERDLEALMDTYGLGALLDILAQVQARRGEAYLGNANVGPEWRYGARLAHVLRMAAQKARHVHEPATG